MALGGVESSDLGRANPQGGSSLSRALLSLLPLPSLPSLTSQTWKQKPGGVVSGCSSLLQWGGDRPGAWCPCQLAGMGWWQCSDPGGVFLELHGQALAFFPAHVPHFP